MLQPDLMFAHLPFLGVLHLFDLALKVENSYLVIELDSAKDTAAGFHAFLDFNFGSEFLGHLNVRESLGLFVECLSVVVYHRHSLVLACKF